MGKFKDWETMVIITEQAGKVCFAQSNQYYKLLKSNPREARCLY